MVNLISLHIYVKSQFLEAKRLFHGKSVFTSVTARSLENSFQQKL